MTLTNGSGKSHSNDSMENRAMETTGLLANRQASFGETNGGTESSVDNLSVSHGSPPPTGASRSLGNKGSFGSRSLRDFLEHWTTHERQDALRRPGVGSAALLIRDAVLGQEPVSEKYDEQLYNPYNSSPDPANEDFSMLDIIAILCGRLSSYDWMARLVKLSAWMLALLTFVEPPYWCRVEDGRNDNGMDAFGDSGAAGDAQFELEGIDGHCHRLFAARGPVDADTSTDVYYYPNATWILLTLSEARLAELILITFITFYVFLRFGRNGFRWRIHFQRTSMGVQRSLRFLATILIYLGLFTHHTQLHPYLRLFILGTFHNSFQREFTTFLRMIPEIIYILALLGVIIFFYAWFGTVVFYGTAEGKDHFPNLIDSLWTLWQMVTTVIYPDVMMTSYNKSRLSAIYFVSFMIISLFFIMNLILASVVNAYDSDIDRRKKSRSFHSKRNLAKAFQLMDPNNTGSIDSQTIMAVFYILNNDFPDFRYIPKDATQILFALLDKDGTSKIKLEEFLNFGDVLLLRLTKASDYATTVEVCFPRTYRSDWYQSLLSFVKSGKFDHIIDVLLVLNAIVIGIQSYPELAGMEPDINPDYADGQIDTIWEKLETIFTVLYCLEVAIKVMVFGWKAYSESARNTFDFVITVSALCATAYVYYPNGYYDSRLIRFIVMARVLRLMRLLLAVPQFQLIGRIAAEIIPAASSVLLFLFFLLYFFSALGMTLFGGIITRDPNNPHSERLEGTDFANTQYWANNFNDMMSGMNVLFNLLVINNWQICAYGIEAAADTRWVRWYFFAFHVLGVVLINNLVQAVVINAFFQQLENRRNSTEDVVVEGEAIIRQQTALFDATEVTGTKTGASGGYVARIQAIHSDIDVNEREQLKTLFTNSSRSSNNLAGDAGDNDDAKA